MDSYKETFETWDKIAQIYEDKFMSLDLYNASYDAFCNMISKKYPRVLELGCGPGNITKYIHEKRPDFKIEAIDVAPNMIELAKKNCPDVDFKVMDIRLINQLESNYDGIICGFCIPYISQSELIQLISDSNQLLNKSGVLYLSFVDGDYSDSGYQVGSSGDRTYFYYHSLIDIVKEIEKQSFKIQSLLPVLYTKSDDNKEIHTVIIAQKSL
jgi:2-polyprenyl-3-methyl-5-hydroxy-6-metoxy-1,4-benzoquinol methylase